MALAAVIVPNFDHDRITLYEQPKTAHVRTITAKLEISQLPMDVRSKEFGGTSPPMTAVWKPGFNFSFVNGQPRPVTAVVEQKLS